MTKIRNKLKSGGILNNKGGYGVKVSVMNANDADIIIYYSSLAHGMLSYYRCADNLRDIKRLVMHILKFSLMTTLRVKHRLNKADFARIYGDQITCKDYKGNEISYLSNMQVYNLRKEFLTNIKDNPFKDMNKVLTRLTRSPINQGQCAVKDCSCTDIEIHHLRQLYRRTQDGKGFTIITAGKAKRLYGRAAIESALNRKQIPLCSQHHNA